MTLRPTLLAVAALAVAAPLVAQQPTDPADPADPPGLALVNATVIDGTGAAPRPDMTILIRDGRIVEIRPTGTGDVPAGTRIEDLQGGFVIPGLIDAHVHLGFGPLDTQLERLRLQLEGGVTTLRDPSGDPRVTGYLSRQALVGEIASPDIFFAALMGGPGFASYGPVAAVSRGWEPGRAPWAREVHDTTDVVRVIAEARGTGATGIKLYRYLSPDLTSALAAEALRQGMRVWSHARVRGHNRTGEPSSRPGEVVAAGAQVLSHANHFACEVMSCASGEERSRAVATVDPAHPAIRAVLECMAAGGTVLDPTLLDAAAEPEPHWLRFAAAVTGLAHGAGVPVAAGSHDFLSEPAGQALPLLHRELELLVTEAGLTPAAAIVAATATAARTVGQEASRGTIEPGKRADLVVLRDDPTTDIRNTRSIALVLKGGEVVHDGPGDAVRDLGVGNRITGPEASDSVDRLVRAHMEALEIPGLSLAVMRDGEVVKQAAYGLASLELKVPTTAATVFPLASMAKVFTGTAVLRLVQESRFSLEDPITDLLPDLPDAWRSVTVRHLLAHTSGLPDLNEGRIFRNPFLAPRETRQEILDALIQQPVAAAPGEAYAYNQTNYLLLAMLIEEWDGRTIEQYVQEELAAPLGLESLAYGDSRLPMPSRASWYTRLDLASGTPRPGPVRPLWTEYPPFLHAAAGLNGTALDLARFVESVASGRLLEERNRREMWTAVSLGDGTVLRFDDGLTGSGLGWRVHDDPEQPWVAMGGAGAGSLRHYVNDAITIVVLTNLQGAEPERLVDALAGIYLP